jgi:hypothetical protein
VSSTDEFLRFHGEHAHLYDALVELGFRLAESGNHDLPGFYLRLIAHREPALRYFVDDLLTRDHRAAWQAAGDDLGWLEEAA